MKFEEREVDQADPLRFIRFLVVTIFDTFIVKCLLVNISVINVVVLLMQTYETTMDFNRTVVLKNAPMYFMQIFVLISIFFIWYFVKVVDLAQGRCPKWQPNVGNDKVQNKFARECKRLTIYLCCFLTFSFIGSCVFVVPQSDDHEYFFVIDVIEEEMSELGFFLIPGVKVLMLFVSVVMQMPYCQIVYSFQNEKFRYYCLIDHLENLNMDYEDMNPNITHSTEYQENIEQRLEYCVKRHVELFELHKATFARSAIIIVLFSISGALINISMLVFILLVRDIPLLVYYRVVFSTVVCVVTLIAYIAAGQDVEDSYAKIYTALNNVRWYYWSTKNQNTYLKMLIIGGKPLEIKFSDSVVFNYKLGLKIVKAAYSICCVVYRTA